MKVKVNKSVQEEVEVKTLRMDISVYYEDISDDFPLNTDFHTKINYD